MKIANPVDLIIIRDNKILLAKRAEEEDTYKDTWAIPGGGPNPEESIEEALHREIKEELGCTISWCKYFKSYSTISDIIVRSFYFYGDIKGEIQLNEELSEYQWIDINDPKLFELNYAFNQKQVITEFIDFWKQLDKKDN